MKLNPGELPGYGDPETWGGRSPDPEESDLEVRVEEFLDDALAFDEQAREHFYDALDLASNFEEDPIALGDPVEQYRDFIDGLIRATKDSDYLAAGQLVVEALRRYAEKVVEAEEG